MLRAIFELRWPGFFFAAFAAYSAVGNPLEHGNRSIVAELGRCLFDDGGDEPCWRNSGCLVGRVLDQPGHVLDADSIFAEFIDPIGVEDYVVSRLDAFYIGLDLDVGRKSAEPWDVFGAPALRDEVFIGKLASQENRRRRAGGDPFHLAFRKLQEQ